MHFLCIINLYILCYFYFRLFKKKKKKLLEVIQSLNQFIFNHKLFLFFLDSFVSFFVTSFSL